MDNVESDRMMDRICDAFPMPRWSKGRRAEYLLQLQRYSVAAVDAGVTEVHGAWTKDHAPPVGVYVEAVRRHAGRVGSGPSEVVFGRGCPDCRRLGVRPADAVKAHTWIDGGSIVHCVAHGCGWPGQIGASVGGMTPVASTVGGKVPPASSERSTGGLARVRAPETVNGGSSRKAEPAGNGRARSLAGTEGAAGTSTFPPVDRGQGLAENAAPGELGAPEDAGAIPWGTVAGRGHEKAPGLPGA